MLTTLDKDKYRLTKTSVATDGEQQSDDLSKISDDTGELSLRDGFESASSHRASREEKLESQRQKRDQAQREKENC